MQYSVTTNGDTFDIEIIDGKHVRLGEKIVEVDFQAISGQPVYTLLVDGKSYEAYVQQSDGCWQVILMGRFYALKVEDERDRMLRKAGVGDSFSDAEFQLKAPMPGLVIDVPVKEEQEVKKGDVLVILESMKMQNELRSPQNGTVSRIRVKTGDNVEQHQLLLCVH